MTVNSLAEVRENIDRLDHAIIHLMAERGTFVEAAARFKSSHADVEAPKRVEQVIAKVRALAETAKLSTLGRRGDLSRYDPSFIEVERSAFERR